MLFQTLTPALPSMRWVAGRSLVEQVWERPLLEVIQPSTYLRAFAAVLAGRP